MQFAWICSSPIFWTQEVDGGHEKNHGNRGAVQRCGRESPLTDGLHGEWSGGLVGGSENCDVVFGSRAASSWMVMEWVVRGISPETSFGRYAPSGKVKFRRAVCVSARRKVTLMRLRFAIGLPTLYSRSSFEITEGEE